MSGPHVEDPAPLAVRLIGYYRQMMAAHANGRLTGACPICEVGRCEDWRFARERLLCAGEHVDELDPVADLARAEAER